MTSHEHGNRSQPGHAHDRNAPDRNSPIEAQLASPPADDEVIEDEVVEDEVIEATLVDDSWPGSGSTATDGSAFVQSRGAVFATLFLVTGVLGIPLLWMNQKFSNTERIVWSVIVTVYTAILIAIAYAIVMWSYRQIFG